MLSDEGVQLSLKPCTKQLVTMSCQCADLLAAWADLAPGVVCACAHWAAGSVAVSGSGIVLGSLCTTVRHCAWVTVRH